MNKPIVIIYIILLFCLFLLIKECKSSNLELINLNNKIEKYVSKINPSLNENQLKDISLFIINESIYYNIPWIITLAIMEVESHFNPKAVSPVGAKGLMQVYTLKCCGINFNKEQLFNIQYNISAGLCIFRDKLKISNYNLIKAIGLYNGTGPDARKFVIRVLDILNKLNKEFYIIY